MSEHSDCPATLQDPVRHKEVDLLLGPVPGEKFAQLVALGKLITDCAPQEAVSWRCHLLWPPSVLLLATAAAVGGPRTAMFPPVLPPGRMQPPLCAGAAVNMQS